MPITAAQLVHDPDFHFDDLVSGDGTLDQLILGPTSSYCPHNGPRVYDPKHDEIICLVCGDIVPHAQLEAERATPQPAIELP